MLGHGRKHEKCDLPWVEKDHIYSRRKLPVSRVLVERTGVPLTQVSTLVQTLLPLKMNLGHLVKTNSLDDKDQDISSRNYQDQLGVKSILSVLVCCFIFLLVFVSMISNTQRFLNLPIIWANPPPFHSYTIFEYTPVVGLLYSHLKNM